MVSVQSCVIERDSIPSVMNMGIKDAMYLLENQGYRVLFTGRGRVVSQSYSPSSTAGNKGNNKHSTF